ncbi:DUF6221 family protein [Nocardioides sp.]|uniref:DUF6221 family protein n=1 Tax=Nocardioides sp. TaxID=35761 RepID=UPI00261F00F9|nr:DUF6221 family protein [Nocardioides sp.]
MTITEFLLARIAEDEATASNVSRFEIRDGIPGNYAITARVLAECEAKRRIVDEHGELVLAPDRGARAYTGECRTCAVNEEADYDGAPSVLLPCPTLRLLALPYAGHSDCREEWRP